MRAGFLATVVLIGLFSTKAEATPKGFGTGFAIGDGSLIVTAGHVVRGCASIQIPGVGAATLLREAPRSDLAILKPSRPLPTGLRFRSGHPVKLGEDIVVIGYPLRGLLSSGPTVTTGTVSALAGLRDDPTEMQISAPVQPGNSGGPVLDRSGNVVGVVESKLNAIKAAALTGDIPQNVNFAIQSSLVTSLLGSYSMKYSIGTFTEQKSVADIVAASVPAIVVIECMDEEPPHRPSSAVNPPSPSPRETSAPAAPQELALCGRSVTYSLGETGGGSPFLGAWEGNWNNRARLCGGLIVEALYPNGTAEVVYVYGPSRRGSRLRWKAQRQMAFLRNGERLSFRDDQGSNFEFDLIAPNSLHAMFFSRSGRLSGSFQRLR